MPDCVAEHLDDLGACSGLRSDWVPAEPLQAAFDARSGRHCPRSSISTTTSATEKTCAAVVGGVIVYSDSSHLTATYARTLAPVLRPSLDRVLRR